MESIIPDVIEVIDIWLGGFNEQKCNKLNNLCERIQKTVQTTPQIQYTSSLWLDIFKFLTDNSHTTKEEMVWKVLLLRESGEISRNITYKMIIKLLM